MQLASRPLPVVWRVRYLADRRTPHRNPILTPAAQAAGLIRGVKEKAPSEALCSITEVDMENYQKLEKVGEGELV